MKKIFPFLFVILSFSLVAKEKTFIRDFTYNASDVDSKVSCRAIAIKELRSLLLNEIGFYVESESILTTSEVGENFSQDFVENISTITAGITKLVILDETWDGKTFWMKASITIDEKSLEKSLKQLIADRQKMKELEQTKQRLQSSEKEIARINQELNDNKAANLEELAEKYNVEIKKIVAIDHYESGWDKYYLDDFAGAIIDFTIAIKSAPDFASAYNNRGIAKYDLGDYKGAIADYTKAIEIDPDDAHAYYNRGNVKQKLKDYYGAIADYNNAIELDLDYAVAYSNRGVVKRNLEDYKGAIADYTKAIEIDPDGALAYNNRGNVKADLEDYKGAIADYTKAIELDPEYAAAYYNRGNVKADLEDYKGAIADYTKAIEIDPDYVDAYYSNRGIAKENAGLPYCSDYKKACELGYEDACGWYNQQCR
tara:strand:- start:4307 stop:5587 length:1281 start_codon:yes stop_codon:yes gene_type:complete